MRRAFLLVFFLTTSGAFGATADLRSRLDAIAQRPPQFKQQLDQRRARGEDASYPLVTYTVLDNFTRYCQADLQTSIPSGWGLNDVNGCDAKYEPAHEAHAGEWAARIANKTPQ